MDFWLFIYRPIRAIGKYIIQIKTRVAGGALFTDGYDVVDELETQDDPHGTA